MSRRAEKHHRMSAPWQGCQRPAHARHVEEDRQRAACRGRGPPTRVHSLTLHDRSHVPCEDFDEVQCTTQSHAGHRIKPLGRAPLLRIHAPDALRAQRAKGLTCIGGHLHPYNIVFESTAWKTISISLQQLVPVHLNTPNACEHVRHAHFARRALGLHKVRLQRAATSVRVCLGPLTRVPVSAVGGNRCAGGQRA